MRLLGLLVFLVSSSWAAVAVQSGATASARTGVTTTSVSILNDYAGIDPDTRDTIFYFSGTSNTPEIGGVAGLNNPVGAGMDTYGSAVIEANSNDSGNLWLHLPGDGNFPQKRFYNESNSPHFGYLNSGKLRTRMYFMYHGTWASGATLLFINGKVPSTTSKYYANGFGSQIGTTSVSSVTALNGAGTVSYAMSADTSYQVEQRVETSLVADGRRLGRMYIKNAAGTVLAAAYTTAATISSVSFTPARHQFLAGNDTAVVLELWEKQIRVQTSFPFDLTIPDPANWHNMEQASVALCGFTEVGSPSRFSLVSDSSLQSGCTIDLVADTGTQLLRYSANGTAQNSAKKLINQAGNPAGIGVRLRFGGSQTSGTQNVIFYTTDSVNETRNIIKVILKNVSGEYRLYLNNATTGDSSSYVVVSIGTIYDVTVWPKKGAVNNYLIVRNPTTGALIGKITHASTGTNPRDFYWFAIGCEQTQTANALTMDVDNLVYDPTLPEPTASDPLSLNFASNQY